MSSWRSLDFESLRLLVAVGASGSLGRAAREQSISQPAASKRVAALERKLQVPLLIRTPRGSTLTSEGQVVADWARRVLDTADQMLGAVDSLRDNVDRDLQVAASMTIAEHLVPTWLSTLRTAHPDVHVGLRVANSTDVQKLVLDDAVNIGFVETPSLDGRLASKQVARDRLIVVVGPRHEWTRRRRPLSLDELAHTRLVVREPGSGTRVTLEKLLDGIPHIEPLLELGSNAAVKGAVLAGSGAAVLSVLAVSTDLAAGRLVEVRLRDVDLSRRLHAVWPIGRSLTGSAAALLDIAASTSPRGKQ